jgi:sec-independent protein translocase protein TatC
MTQEEDKELHFLDHVEALRLVLVKSLLVIAVAMAVSCFGARDILQGLQAPLYHAMSERGLDASRVLITLGVTDSFNLLIYIGLVCGCVVSAPFVLWFITQFFLPAMSPREKRWILPSMLGFLALFGLGAGFSYFWILPPSIGFFLDFNAWLGWQANWTIQSYLQFTLHLLIGVGLAFELPLVILLLSKLELLTSQTLQNYRRHAIVILLIAAACITPTSDPYNLLLVFVPLYALYEISVWVCWWLERKRSH